MRSLALGGILGLVAASVASASFGSLALAQDKQDTTDKRELRYKFEKGEKVGFAIKQKMHVKLDEVPEEFQGIAPEEPFDSAIEGDAEFEVKDVAEGGKAVLEGRFQTLKAKGSFLGQDFDFSYDRARDGDQPKGGGEEDPMDDPGMPGGMANPEDLLRKMATSTLKLEIDARGKFKVTGTGGPGGGMATQLLDLGGLIGQLPKEKIGAGDSWKNSDSLSLPGLPFKMRVKSDNKYEKNEKVDNRDCAVIQSKFTVGSEEGEEEEEDFPLPIRPKFTGEGKGTMFFAVEAGRPVKNDLGMNVKLSVTVANPQGGEDVEIKGTFKMEQSLGVKKKEY